MVKLGELIRGRLVVCRVKTFIAVLAMATWLSGCVLSREPFYSADAIIEPLKLDGTWHLLDRQGAAEKNEYWEFKGNKALAFDERGQWRSFTVTYFNVDGVTFADTIPDGPGDDIASSEAYRSLHLVPYHMLSRVELAGDRFTLRPLLTREFKEATKKKPVATWSVQTDYETYVFNASSADWAAFLKKHGKDEGLFSEESKLVFVRQTE